MAFNKIYKYYDLIYKDKDYLGEADHVNSIIKKHNPSFSLLEYGSGTGKYTEIFKSKNYKIKGVEISDEMHRIAIKKGLDSINQNMISFKSEEKFDNAISMFHVFSYLNSDNDINVFFKNLHHNIKKKGLFVFDAWYTPSVLHLKPTVRKKNYKDNQISIERTSYPEIITKSNSVKVNFLFKIQDNVNGEIQKISETHLMRHFSIPEIQEYAYSHGFKLIDSCELVTKKLPSNETWSLLHTIQKK